MPRDGAARMREGIAAAEEFGWADPDMAVLRLHRRPPPALPLAVFGDEWGRWIADAAEAAACPPDYVAVPLLASVSAVIGHARWAQATPGWSEPPHLWMADVGDSGVGKSPGADCLLRDVLPEIERAHARRFSRPAARVARRCRAGESRHARHGRTKFAPRRSRARRRPHRRRSRDGTASAAPAAERCDDRARRDIARHRGPEGLADRPRRTGRLDHRNERIQRCRAGVLDRGVRRPAVPGRAAEAPRADHRAEARGVGIRRRSAGSPRAADARGR